VTRLETRRKEIQDKARFLSLSEKRRKELTEQGNNPFESPETRSVRKKIFRAKRSKEMRKAGAPETLIRRLYGDSRYCTNALHPGGNFIESNDAVKA